MSSASKPLHEPRTESLLDHERAMLGRLRHGKASISELRAATYNTMKEPSIKAAHDLTANSLVWMNHSDCITAHGDETFSITSKGNALLLR